MISKASGKVKEGKLVKVEIDHDDLINHVRITGDFFLHPEDFLEQIERGLEGLNMNSSKDAIVFTINRIIGDEDVQMIGISPDSLAMVIKEALQ